MADLKELQAQINTLKAQNDVLETSVTDLTKDNEAKQKQIDTLSAKLSDTKAPASAASDIKPIKVDGKNYRARFAKIKSGGETIDLSKLSAAALKEVYQTSPSAFVAV